MAVMQVGLLLKVCALICSWMILGSAVSPVGDGALRHLSDVNAFTGIAPAPVPEPNGPGLLPPLIMPPQLSSPAPQTAESISPSAWPSPSASPPNVFAPPPAKANVPSMALIPSLEKPQLPEPPYPVQAPAPQTVKRLPPTAWPSPSTSPTNLSVSPPAPVVAYVPPPMAPISPPEKLQPPEPQLPMQAPAPDTSPRSSPPYMQTYPPVPETEPADPHHSKAPINGAPRTAVSPVSDVPAPIGMLHSPPPHESVINAPPPRGMPDAPPPSQSVPNAPSSRGTPVAPPPSQLVANSPSHKGTPDAPSPSQSVTNTSSPRGTPNTALPSQSVSNASSPKGMQDASPPSQSVSHVPAPRGMPGSPSPPDSSVPVEPPSPPPPEQNDFPVASPSSISKRTAARPVAAPRNITVRHSVPGRHSPSEAPVHSPLRSYHPMVHKITPAPQMQVIPPTSGSSASSPPIPPTKDPPKTAPSLAPPFREAKVPVVSPIVSPSVPSTRRPKRPLSPPLQALPPPPPQKDCAPLTCIEPLTYGPPESPCICVLPMQVGLCLSIAPYTFFPLVSELAAEIAVGAFMRQSQVRIMGATPAGYDPEKTVVIIYLLPVGEKIDDTTAYLIFQRFWRKQVAIKASFFGDYEILYVRYPGLPPSPPLPPSAIGVIASKPYPGHDNNARTMQPFGVDVSGKQHKHGIRGSILATIIMSCFVAVILICAVGWILIFRYRYHIFQPDPTPPAAVRSMAKSSGIAVSMRSGPSSPSFSLGSSMAAYTGSVRTFSASEIERAADFFDKTRILGEGGFGRVYSAALDDGTKVAIKVLKRFDQQSGREFLAEVEMLSRLHHRNLVKLIGLCVEDRIHCLLYELIPNGSVESHLHGIDKERSPLDWSARLKIALGAARALAYLHEDSSPRVIHRDFKASNILLEDDFTPKVSDFGLARTAFDEENRHISTRVMGTFGYVAPEYAMTGHLLVKSDVYSYGVVLLELLSGRKPVDMYRTPGEENLVSWARPLLTSQEGLEAIIDQSLGPDFPLDSIAKIAAITSMCVQPEVSHRPFMGEVVQALKLVVRNECDGMKESPSRSSSHDVRPTAVEQMPTSLLSPSTIYDYDYRLDLERDLIVSELLESSTKSGNQDIHQSFRRYSSSGALRTEKEKTLWKTMRQFKRSMSEHGVPFKPGGNSY